MKCPKCGYNSFEYLDTCKKCNNSLTAFRESLGLRPVILPAQVAMTSVAAGVADTPGIHPEGAVGGGDDIFQWDMPSSAPPVSQGDSGIGEFDLKMSEEDTPLFSLSPDQQPGQDSVGSTFGEFSFDDTAGSQPSGSFEPGPATLDDQTAPHSLPYDPFEDLNRELKEEVPDQPAVSAAEFDLSSFLDQEPGATQDGAATKLSGCEFDELFGELDNPEKKS